MARTELDKKKDKLRKRLSEATAKGDIIRQAHILKELTDLDRKVITKDRVAFKTAADRFSPEVKQKGFAALIYLTALADMTDGAAREMEKWFRSSLGLVDVSVVQYLRKASAELEKVVALIDACRDEIFSYSYMDIVEELEAKYRAQMETFIYNRIARFAREYRSAVPQGDADLQNSRKS